MLPLDSLRATKALVGSALLCVGLMASAQAAPVFDATRGIHDEPFELNITPSDASDGLLVSVDGTAPSVPYAGPISISGTTIVRAAEVAPDGTESSVVTNTYLFISDIVSSAVMDPSVTTDPTYGPIVDATLRALPTISIVTPSTLTTTEQAVSAEWIDPDGGNVQIDCGAELTGTTSLGYPKNSIRLYFRSEYGASNLTFDLWGPDYTGVAPAKTHDSISFRTGHDSVFYLGAQGQYTRNLWMDESQLAMGRLAPHGRFAHLYVNGTYNGLYHVRERFNAAFMAEYLGGAENDYEMVNQGTVISGSGTGWGSVMADAQDFQDIQHWLNVPDFLDYMVLNFYAGNAWDWSAFHNWAAAGPSAPDAGGFSFESSDSDIVLYYDYTVDITTNPGPSNLFSYLMSEADPDFLVALEDAIHRNLEAGGPLTADVASERYSRLATMAEDGVVAESARWGGGWWTRDADWIPERDRLLNQFFPYRTDESLRQFRADGWYPLDAPELSQDPGTVATGTQVTVSVPDASSAELWVTVDGEDPRVSGGEVYAGAEGPDVTRTVAIDHSTVVKARLRDGATWGPLAEAFYEVDEAPPIILNEWNAVDDGNFLAQGSGAGSGEDAALGRIAGNGGDWIELLVMQDGLDLRGWRITMEDRRGSAGILTFTDDALLSNLRAGTIVTIAEDLPEDASYDPSAGDWRFHLRASTAGSGRYVSATDFRVSQLDWQATFWDADGRVRFGPVGEGVAPKSGISSSEVGLLAEDPSPAIRRDSSGYTDGTHSTFGAPNEWDGGFQDLSSLRGQTGAVVEIGDSGATSGPAEQAPDTTVPAGGCGCATTGGEFGAFGELFALFGALGFTMIRRSAAMSCAIVVIEGCTGNTTVAVDTDTTGDGDTQACFVDHDLDGFGDPASPAASCGAGTSTDATDCDDNDAAVHPDAIEVCDGIDDDCDGIADEPGDVADPLPFYADADGDGYGADDVIVLACTVGEGAAAQGGDCDDADPDIHPGASEQCDGVDRDCDGVSGSEGGVSPACGAASCLAILTALGSAPDGLRWLVLPSGNTTQVWCDMTTDGGGWTLGFLRNTASTGSQGGFGGGESAIADLAASPEDASSSATPRLGWLDLNAFDWTDLHLTASYNGSRSYTSRDIPRAELRIAFGEDGYLLYGGDTAYYWCGGDHSYTDGGIGATNNPDGAPAGCKGHGSLGSGWDFSESPSTNAGLTLCGADGSDFLAATWGGTWISYGLAGGAQAIWVR